MTESPVDMDAIRAVLAKATPGPWRWTSKEDQWGDCGPNLEGESPKFVVSAWGHDAWGINVDSADAELIVLLRNNAEVLLSELERLRSVEPH